MKQIQEPDQPRRHSFFKDLKEWWKELGLIAATVLFLEWIISNVIRSFVSPIVTTMVMILTLVLFAVGFLHFRHRRDK